MTSQNYKIDKCSPITELFIPRLLKSVQFVDESGPWVMLMTEISCLGLQEVVKAGPEVRNFAISA